MVLSKQTNKNKYTQRKQLQVIVAFTRPLLECADHLLLKPPPSCNQNVCHLIRAAHQLLLDFQNLTTPAHGFLDRRQIPRKAADSSALLFVYPVLYVLSGANASRRVSEPPRLLTKPSIGWVSQAPMNCTQRLSP